MKERRKCPRELTPYTALYCSYNGVRAVKLKDLSHSGAAIVFKDSIDISREEVTFIHFYSRGLNKLISKLQCRVIRGFEDEGNFAIGVEFINNDPRIDEVIAFLKGIHIGNIA